MTRFVVALALLFVFCSHADAQTSPWQREERTTGGWTFTPGTALGGMWDSGINTDANPFGDGLVEKWVGTANPRAELDYNGRLSHANFGYSSTLEKYWGSDLRWEQFARAGGRRALSPHVSVSGDVSFAKADTTDRLQFTEGVVPFVNVNSNTVNTDATIEWRASVRTNLSASYRFQRVTLENNGLALVGFGALRDGYSHTPSVGFTRDFTSRLSAGATATYSRESVDQGFNQFDVKTLSGELSYRWSAVMSIAGGAGASVVYSELLDAQTTAPTFHAGFTRQMRVWQLSGRYEHSIEQLFGFGTLAPTHRITSAAYMPFADRRYYLDAALSYDKTEELRDLAVGANLSTLWTTVAVGRQLAPRLRGEAFLGVARQSGGSIDSSNRTRIGIQIVTSKPLRIQ